VLPGWLRALSWLSPPTFMLRGVRRAVVDGAGIDRVAGDLAIMAAFAVVLIPLSIVVFTAAERWAKKTGRLKRQG
jgi:ABC-2 type transport system permease protein